MDQSLVLGLKGAQDLIFYHFLFCPFPTSFKEKCANILPIPQAAENPFFHGLPFPCPSRRKREKESYVCLTNPKRSPPRLKKKTVIGFGRNWLPRSNFPFNTCVVVKSS